MSGVQVIVYRDRRYPSVWIDDKAGYPDKISSFLHRKGFQMVDADQLRKFMINAIDAHDAHKKLIIFSQDAVPETIAEDYYANTTLREYLDTGGNTLWIGDIPLFYIGKKDGTLDQAWKKGCPLSMLGVIPIFANASEQSVTFTAEGKDLGLKHRWSGTRPIIVNQGVKVFAKSQSIFSYSYIPLPKPKKLSFWESLTFRLKRVETGIKVYGVDIPIIVEFRPPPEKLTAEDEAKLEWRFFRRIFANAWMKNYNEDYPNSGFFRIWDYGPRSLTNYMLEELHNVAITISKRL